MFPRRPRLAPPSGTDLQGEFGKLVNQFWLELNAPGVVPGRLHEMIHLLMVFCLHGQARERPPAALPAHGPEPLLEELTEICCLAMAGEADAAEKLRACVYRHFCGLLTAPAEGSQAAG